MEDRHASNVDVRYSRTVFSLWYLPVFAAGWPLRDGLASAVISVLGCDFCALVVAHQFGILMCM